MTAVIVAWLLIAPPAAQAPSGVVAGSVVDVTGAALAGATVTVTHRDTNQTRVTTTSASGTYVVPGLLPGPYVMIVEAARFKRTERLVTVEAGTTTTANEVLPLGDVRETVTVAPVQPLINHAHHQIAGVVTRLQIQSLPLNGRNVFEDAKLEPGVTQPTRGALNRTFVSVLGSGLSPIPRIGYTRATVDGGHIGSVGATGAGLQVSQEVVQEFQMATAAFDVATGATTNGAINIVTRSGGSQLAGSAFYLYRDHHLSAYPGLTVDARNPDPFFRRQQFGGTIGGPLPGARRHFLASYERNDQHGIASVRPGINAFDGFGGLFPTPALGDLFTARADLGFSARHHAVARYTFDGNQTFTGVGILPSAWARTEGRVHQGLGAVTSVWGAHVVNELRVAYFAPSATQDPATADDCAGCFGLDHPRVVVADAGLTFGRAMRQEFVTHRFELANTVTWLRGPHTVRAGFAWEHGTSRALQSGALTITLWSPDEARRRNPSIVLPASFSTVDDVLQLPFKALETSIGPDSIPERGFQATRVMDLYRVFAADTWRLHPRFTMNGGVAWVYEPNALNHDLDKPAWLAPLVGPGGLAAPRPELGNVTPAGGFTWSVSGDGRTVVRGGAGRYVDPAATTNGTNLGIERIFLSPLGSGRLKVTGAHIVFDGRTLIALDRDPSSFTGADLSRILPDQLNQLAAAYDPGNRDFSVRTIDLLKTGTNLYDASYATPSAVHVSIGVQREIAPSFVISADVVWKRFAHTFINGIDYNRWFTGTPVIAKCSAAQPAEITAACSNGPIFFDTTIGRARYRGLLLRAERRLSRGWQVLASYAYGSYVGANGTGIAAATAEMVTAGRAFGFNNDNWAENYGPLPTDLRHIMNVSGLAPLPWQMQLAFNVSAYSRPPFSAFVQGKDFNLDGTTNDLLPGSSVNQFGRSLDKSDLVRLVDEYNLRYAPALELPASYEFDDAFFTQDVRISRSFRLGRGPARLLLLFEVFNLLNTANLVGYSGNLSNARFFGQPTARFTQVFGSGGPRAAQLGARVSF
jgi:hypothetical protein